MKKYKTGLTATSPLKKYLPEYIPAPSGALLETEARTILNRGKDEAKKETALRMLQDGELSW